MPFHPIDFASIEPQGNPFFKDLITNLATGYKAGQLPAQLERQRQKEELANQYQKYLVEEQPQKFSEESQGRQLKNAFQSILNQQQPQKFSSEQATRAIERALTAAQANKLNVMTPLEAQKQALENAWYPKVTQAKIDYETIGGGSGLSTGAREEQNFNKVMKEYNPTLTPDEMLEANTVIREGGKQLANGKKLNIVPAMTASLDRIEKAGSYSGIIVPRKTMQEAQKAMPVLTNYITAAVEPFGTTVKGYNPKQIFTSLSNATDDQMAIGRYMASYTLQTDLAAVTNRLNSGRATATITKEILERMPQLKVVLAQMTPTAQKEYYRYLNEALDAEAAARLEVPTGAFSAHTGSNKSSEKRRVFNLQTGKYRE